MGITGTVELLKETFGFVRGEDGISRFFIPNALQQSQRVTFEDLSVGTRVKFVHIDHPRGPRAIEILVIGNGDGDGNQKAR